jgi:hypothetical protein
VQCNLNKAKQNEEELSGWHNDPPRAGKPLPEVLETALPHALANPSGEAYFGNIPRIESGLGRQYS